MHLIFVLLEDEICKEDVVTQFGHHHTVDGVAECHDAVPEKVVSERALVVDSLESVGDRSCLDSSDPGTLGSAFSTAIGDFEFFGEGVPKRAIYKSKIIDMGTGLGVSLVLDDADLKETARSICTSGSVNNGMECIGTKIIYVQDKIYDEFISYIDKISKEFKSGNPLDERNKIGIIPTHNIDYIEKKLKEIDKHPHLRISNNLLHLSYVELNDEHHFEEFPGPVFGLRRVKDEDNFIHKFVTER